MLVKFLSSLSIGFLFGVFIHSVFFSTPLTIVPLGIILGIALGLLLFKNHYIILISIFLVGVVFGLLRFGSIIDAQRQQILDVFWYKNVSIQLQGTIDSEPIATPAYTQFTVATDTITARNNESLAVDTGILVTTDNYTDYEYGQIVNIQGKINKPESFITDTDRIFDYQSYLSKDNIYYIMRFAETSIVNNGKQSIQRRLYSLKQKFLYQMYRYIPEPESGLLAGILFGQKSALGDEWEETFRVVGLMHIVVLSGYNVSLVIQIFTKTLRFLPRGIRSLLAVLGIAAFALLVGAGPTVIRASIMAVFIVLADVLGARYHITRALFFAGLVMVVWNPMILYFDISFQLSFLATYGLIAVSPMVERWLQRLPTIFAIRDSAVATISAQIMVVPIILYTIGEFSLISPVVNVLVLFAVPWVMLFGFITAVLGIAIPLFTPLLAFITTYLLKYQLWVADVFASIPFANITVPPFHILLVIGMYLFIFWWIYSARNTDLKI